MHATPPADLPLVADELDLLARLVPLERAALVELGCGSARLARDLLQRWPGSSVVGLEVDERQHAKNLLAPQPGLAFVQAGAQAIPCADASFDGALMLKSLHHVPVADMQAALAEVARVLRPAGWLYVSEPVFAGPFNEVTRLFNDEGEVRAQAQAALDRALATGRWTQAAEEWFEAPMAFASFADFEQRMMHATYADHRIDAALHDRVRQRYGAFAQADGSVAFTRPMHVRLLRKAG